MPSFKNLQLRDHFAFILCASAPGVVVYARQEPSFLRVSYVRVFFGSQARGGVCSLCMYFVIPYTRSHMQRNAGCQAIPSSP